MQLIKENDMGPFYELICQELDTQIDAKLLADLKAKNEKRIAEIEAEIKDAEENLGRLLVGAPFCLGGCVINARQWAAMNY